MRRSSSVLPILLVLCSVFPLLGQGAIAREMAERAARRGGRVAAATEARVLASVEAKTLSGAERSVERRLMAESAPTVEARLPDRLYHYTYADAQTLESINRRGLRPGTFVTPNGDLKPLQAHFGLGLVPTKPLPNVRIEIDVKSYLEAGKLPPTPPSRVTNTVVDNTRKRLYNNVAGGETQMVFDADVPSQYLRIMPLE